MRRTLIFRMIAWVEGVIRTAMPNASDSLVLGTLSAAMFFICSIIAGTITAPLILLGVTPASWGEWFFFSAGGGALLLIALFHINDDQYGRAVLWFLGYLACFLFCTMPALNKLTWWFTAITVVVAVIVLTQAICQIYPGFCRRGRRILQARVWPGIKESFRFMKVNLKYSGRHTARWWRNDAKPWIKATALPWVEKALKWFFELLWGNKWAILAIGGGYLTYELYNPRKGEWYEVWKWGKQSWWWITSITVATVATLVWLPALRDKLFELIAEAFGVVVSTYRAHYKTHITGKWAAVYWLSLVGTPAAVWWLWDNHHRKGLWVIAIVGGVCLFIAHFGGQVDKWAKKVAKDWEEAAKAKPAKS